MSEASKLAGLVHLLVEPIVEHKDDLVISEAVSESGAEVIEIRVHEDDAGKVIGRQGRVIKAIRTLVHAAAGRSGSLVEVELID